MKYPALVIATKIEKILKIMADQDALMYKVTDAASLREFVTAFSDVEPSRIVVLYDMYYVKRQSSILLKFIEEFKHPLIVISSQDGLSPVFMSRFPYIKKMLDVPRNMRNNPAVLRDRWREEEPDVSTRNNEILRECPRVISITERIMNTSMVSKSKVIEVLLS